MKKLEKIPDLDAWESEGFKAVSGSNKPGLIPTFFMLEKA